MIFKRKRAGFSLIEVTIGMALVAGMALVVSTMIQWQAKSSRGVTSIIDRNNINNRLTAWASDGSMCGKIFGPSPKFVPTYNKDLDLTIQSFPAIYDGNFKNQVYLKIYDPKSYDPTNAVKIQNIFLIERNPAATPAPIGLDKEAYNLDLRIRLDKSQPGLKMQANQVDQNINVGSDSLREISIPIVATVDLATKSILSCSSSGKAGQGCKPGEFPASTDSDGNAFCCAVGRHVEIDSLGESHCCDRGTFWKNGGCSLPGETVCATMPHRGTNGDGNIDNTKPTFAKAVYPDGSAFCCEQVQDDSETSSQANVYCPSDEVMQDLTCRSLNNDSITRFQIGIMPDGKWNGNCQLTRNRVTTRANCCKTIYPTP